MPKNVHGRCSDGLLSAQGAFDAIDFAWRRPKTTTKKCQLRNEQKMQKTKRISKNESISRDIHGVARCKANWFSHVAVWRQPLIITLRRRRGRRRSSFTVCPCTTSPFSTLSQAIDRISWLETKCWWRVTTEEWSSSTTVADQLTNYNRRNDRNITSRDRDVDRMNGTTNEKNESKMSCRSSGGVLHCDCIECGNRPHDARMFFNGCCRTQLHQSWR